MEFDYTKVHSWRAKRKITNTATALHHEMKEEVWKQIRSKVSQEFFRQIKEHFNFDIKKDVATLKCVYTPIMTGEK